MTTSFEFPGRSTGTGLLLLRLSAAGSLISTCLSSPGLPSWGLCLAILVATGLAIGFRTRLLCGLSALGLIAHVAMGSAVPVLAAVGLADSLALALTGPGAFSVDARVFGRRTVFLPHDRDTIV